MRLLWLSVYFSWSSLGSSSRQNYNLWKNRIGIASNGLMHFNLKEHERKDLCVDKANTSKKYLLLFNYSLCAQTALNASNLSSYFSVAIVRLTLFISIMTTCLLNRKLFISDKSIECGCDNVRLQIGKKFQLLLFYCHPNTQNESKYDIKSGKY